MRSFRALVHASVSILALIIACPALAQEMVPGDACLNAGDFMRSGGPEIGGAGHFMVCNGGTWASALSYSSTGNTLVPRGLSLTGGINPAMIGASQNNYNPAGLANASGLRLSASGAYNITGLAGGSLGRIVNVMNAGSNPITLTNEDAASIAANRFALGANLTLGANQSAMLIYDLIAQRWRVVASYGGNTATPAGATNQIQFNSGGVLGADATLVWDYANKRLGIGTASPITRLHIGSGGDTTNVDPDILVSNNGYAGITVRDASIDAEGYLYSWSGAVWVGSYTGSDLNLTTSDTARVTILSTGEVGIGTVAPEATLHVNGSVALSGGINPAQITANQNNYNPAGLTTASVLRLHSDASRDVTGLAGGVDGKIVSINNVGSNNIVLRNENASSTAANRFQLGIDVTLAANQGLTIIYDSAVQRWRPLGALPSTSAASAGGSDRQMQFNNAGALGGVQGFEFKTDGHLDYWQNLTTTAGGSFAHAKFHADVAPTAAQTAGRSTRGLQGAIWVSAGNANQVRKVIGTEGFAQNLGTGAIEDFIGLQGYAWNGGNAAISKMFGIYAGAETDTGTVSDMWGAVAETKVDGGTVSNAYGLLVNNTVTAGTVTNRYGISIAAPTGAATNDWGIYQSGTQNNRFNGAIGISATPVSEKLRVYAATGTGALVVADAGAALNATANGAGQIGVYASAAATTGFSYGLWGTTASSSGVGVVAANTDPAGKPFVARGAASQTGDLTQWQNSAGGVLARVYADGSAYFSTPSTTGIGVYAYSSAATGATYALYGKSNSTGGYGVYGEASATSGTTFGVYGNNYSPDGTAVRGYNRATTGYAMGTYGRSDSTTGQGVTGYASHTTGSNIGVYGETASTSGTGVYGYAAATTGSGAYGVWGETASATGTGVFGLAGSATGENYGVWGETNSPDGYGVYGYSGATSGTNWAVYGDNNSPDGYGVVGDARATTGPATGIAGTTDSTGGRGVYGYAGAATGTTYGVRGYVLSTTGRGVSGYAAATTGINYGVYGTSMSVDGYGVRGAADATSGSNYGVYGETNSPDGYGVYGDVNATTGTSSGVRGRTASSSGRGVSGYASSATGTTYGVYGTSDSPDGYGVRGNATASTGANTGVYVKSDSTTGKGVFGEATATSGTNYGVYGVVGNGSAGYGVYGSNPSILSGYGVYCNSGRTAGCGGNRAWTNTSDLRLKDHIVDLGPDSGVDAIMQLRPVRYRWRQGTDETELGFIAQEVEKVLPELVGIGADQEITYPDGSKETITEVKTMSYSQVTVPLVKAVQELKAENDYLRSTVTELVAANDNLRSDLSALKADNDNLRARLDRLEAQAR
jgi:hypothetical protein